MDRQVPVEPGRPAQLGEFELIAMLRERVAHAGAPATSSRLALASGDDAAVSTGEGVPVTSVDALVEGVHFQRELFSLRQVGHKALATALSDLAAMGAEPGEAYIQLLLPDDVVSAGCLELADGLAEVAASHSVAIAGGDVSRAPVLAVAVTVVGYVDSPAAAVRRSGAIAGDVVVVTGELGGAAAGLEILRHPHHRDLLGSERAEQLVSRQREPQPRLAAGRALADAGAAAMIDISDGLGADAGQIAAASGVAVRIELARLPIQAGVAELAAAAQLDSLELAAGRGEDYELLATVPPDRIEAAEAMVRATGTRLTELGAVTSGAGVQLIGGDGTARSPGGYDQLAHRPAPDAPA